MIGRLFKACVSCRVGETGVEGEGPADVVVAEVEELEEGLAGEGLDFFESGAKTCEEAARYGYVIAYGGCGGRWVGIVGGELADGLLEAMERVVGDDCVWGAGAAADGVAPCEVGGGGCDGEDVGAAGVDEDDAGEDGLLGVDESAFEATGYAFEGVEEARREG